MPLFYFVQCLTVSCHFVIVIFSSSVMLVLTSIDIFNDFLHKYKDMVWCAFFYKKNSETSVIFCLRCMSCICGTMSAAMWRLLLLIQRLQPSNVCHVINLAHVSFSRSGMSSWLSNQIVSWDHRKKYIGEARHLNILEWHRMPD